MRFICRCNTKTIACVRIVCNYVYVDNWGKLTEDLLREAGLRATPARIAVLSLLRTHRKPLNPSEIIGLLNGQPIDQATIYRTLSSLAEAKLVNTVPIKAGVVSYESKALPHHHHVICDRCGYVEDVDGCMVVTPDPGSRFAEIHEHTLEFSGICSQCAT